MTTGAACFPWSETTKILKLPHTDLCKNSTTAINCKCTHCNNNFSFAAAPKSGVSAVETKNQVCRDKNIPCKTHCKFAATNATGGIKALSLLSAHLLLQKNNRQFCCCKVDIVAAKLPPNFASAKVNLSPQSTRLQWQICIYGCKSALCSSKAEKKGSFYS